MSSAVALHQPWPRAVADVLARRPGFARVLARWQRARERLRLGPGAEQAGALLLAIQVDERAYRALVSNAGASGAPARRDLVDGLAPLAAEEDAVQALLDLEERGAAHALDDSGRPWFGAGLALDPRVRAYCLAAAGGESQDPPRAPAAATALGARQLELLGRVRDLLAHAEADRLVVVVRGGWGTGRDTLLGGLAALVGGEVLRKTCYDLRGAVDRLEPELSGLMPAWDARQTDPSPDDYHLASTWLARSPTLAVALLDRHQDAPEVPERQAMVLDTDAASLDERVQGWRQVLRARDAAAAAVPRAADLLARRSRAGIGLAARALAMQPQPLPDEPGELVLAVEESLSALARPSSTRGLVVERPEVPLARLVASDAVNAAIGQLLALARLHTELERPGRKGVKALFAGPSGTGKTMAARAIATELCLPLFRVDLSSVVSKWVGETEKNLRHALEAAEAAGAVLLFDEGDALMSKRGEVARGSDRYANIEVSYLLQAIEAHDGIVVVTTNLRGNLDSAFVRRFDVSVEFGSPTRKARALLWAQELGHPGGDALGAAFLHEASGADLSGGNIAAAARLALALARQRGADSASEQDVCIAISAELLKLSGNVQASQWAQRGRVDGPTG